MNSSQADLAIALDQAKKLFFLEMNEAPTAYLYGSSVAGDWTSARSDLDLLVFIKEAQLPQFLEQLDKWKRLKLPLIDGFLCAEDTSGLSSLRLEDLFQDRPKTAGPIINRILPPDLWQIQNRSKKFFGTSDSLDQLPKVSQQDLQRWATSNRDEYWIPTAEQGIPILSKCDPNTLRPLTPTIWVASGAARIANLIEGGECISKKEALKFFIHHLPQSKTHIQFLIENFDRPDSDPQILTAKQALEISHLCLELLKSTSL